jgi:hypothetical protein
MEIQAPSEVAQAHLAETPVLVNFFAGTERAVVEVMVGDSGEWVPMEFSPQIDPLYARVAARESGQGGSVAYHIWEGRLPSELSIGGHLIQIRATDLYGQGFLGERILRVVEAVAPGG